MKRWRRFRARVLAFLGGVLLPTWCWKRAFNRGFTWEESIAFYRVGCWL